MAEQMKVFFTASLSVKKEYQKTYDRIIHTLQKNNIEVISLELQKYSDLLDEKALKGLNENEIHSKYLKKAISVSSAMIMEASRDNFQLGHEASMALLYKKPVLCLSDKKDYSVKIVHPKFFAKNYKSINEIEGIVNDFIEEIKKKFFSVRFQILLSPEQKNFLDSYGDKTKLNNSEVIRKLIDSKIEEESGDSDGF